MSGGREGNPGVLPAEPRGRSIAFALAAAGLFALSLPAGKTLLSSLGPFELSSLCYFGGGLGLLLYKFAARGSRGAAVGKPLSRADLPYIAGFTLAGGVAAPVLLFSGLKTAQSSSASLLLNFELVFTALLAVLFFGERGGRRFWLAAGLITAGGLALGLRPGGLNLEPGLALVGLSSFMWGLDNNLTARVSGKNTVDLALIKGLAGGTVNAVLAVYADGSLPAVGPAVFALLLGFVSYGVSLAFLIRAMRGLGAARAGAFFGAYPFAGALFSLALPGERAGLRFFAAFGMMAAAALLLLREDPSLQARTPRKPEAV